MSILCMCCPSTLLHCDVMIVGKTQLETTSLTEFSRVDDYGSVSATRSFRLFPTCSSTTKSIIWTPQHLSGRCVSNYAVVTCEIKLFQNHFSLRRRPSAIILPEIISKLFRRLIAAHEYFPMCSVSLK